MIRKKLAAGTTFGYLSVLGEAPFHILPSGKRERKVSCLCECGKIVAVFFQNLKRRKNISCGCHKNDKGIKQLTTHGLSSHPLYSVWAAMKDRCYNKKYHHYHDYGGRGISVCKEWRNSFMSFYTWAIKNGYKSGLQIDRFPDNNGNYKPRNCRFTTASGNSNNRRTCVYYSYNGQLLTLKQISRMVGVEWSTLYQRINFLNMTLTEAVKKEDKRAAGVRKLKKLGVDAIIEIYKSTGASSLVAKTYGVTSSFVRSIRRGDAHSNITQKQKQCV